MQAQNNPDGDRLVSTGRTRATIAIFARRWREGRLAQEMLPMNRAAGLGSRGMHGAKQKPSHPGEGDCFKRSTSGL